MSGKYKFVRLYVTDRPGFLSCGRAYVTNLRNELVLFGDSSDSKHVNLTFVDGRHVPRFLAPFPLPEDMEKIPTHFHVEPLFKGTRVYPYAVTDIYATPHQSEDEVPTVLDRVLLSRKEIMGYVESFTQQSGEYHAKITQAFFGIDARFHSRKQRLDADINAAKAAVVRAHGDAPDLVKMVLAQR